MHDPQPAQTSATRVEQAGSVKLARTKEAHLVTDTEYDYDAFLSYTTEADYLLARDLESFLGRFHELPMPDGKSLKQLRVWRDETGRSAAGAGPRPDVARMLEEYL